MTVYHGSDAPVPIPDLVHSRKAVDFGPGFYVTPIREQAERWCEKRRRRSATASLSIYEFDDASVDSLKVLKFDTYSEAWLDFIVKCRSEHDDSDWDIVIGGVANDRVFDTLEAFFDGFATKQQTIDKLRFAQPNIQICLRTPKALSALTYVRSEAV